MQKDGQQVVKADPRVTAYQAAARLYCASSGLDPDRSVAVPHQQLAGVQVEMPFWYTIAERMFDLALLLRSIGEMQKQAAANDAAKKAETAGA